MGEKRRNLKLRDQSINRVYKFFIFISLFLFICLPVKSGCPCGSLASGSYLRVSQLGYGWLIPDEQVDADYNPATINNIEGKRLFLAFTTDNNYDLQRSSEQVFFGMNTFYVTPFKDLKTAIRYRPVLSLFSQRGGYELITDDFEFMLFLGFPIAYNLKTGLSFGINTYDYDIQYYNIKSYEQNYKLQAGIIYVFNEYLNIGASFSGTSGITNHLVSGGLREKNDNLEMKLSLLPEFIYFKPNWNLILRSFLSLFYNSVLSEFKIPYLWINDDESYYNLNLEIGLGLYYEIPDKTVITFGTKYNQIFNNKNRQYGYNTIITSEYNGFDISVFVGVEKTILVDWILFRIGYNVLKLTNYNKYYFREEMAALVYKSSWKDFSMNFLPELNGNISLGASVKLGNNILFNFSFGKNLIYAHSSEHSIESDNTIKTGFDIELNFIYE